MKIRSKKQMRQNIQQGDGGFYHARIEFDDGSVMGSGTIGFESFDEASSWAERQQVSERGSTIITNSDSPDYDADNSEKE